MDTLSETLRDYISIYKINGIIGGAVNAALIASINAGTFKPVYDRYFENAPGTKLLELKLKDDQAIREEFKNSQVDLVTEMLKHVNQPAAITPGEPTLGQLSGGTHNKYWEILGIAAKLVGGAPGAAPVAGKVTPPGAAPVAGKVTPPGPEPAFITIVRQIIAGNYQEFTNDQITSAHVILYTTLESFLIRYIKTREQRDDIAGILNGATIVDPILRDQRNDIAQTITGMSF
jgi:hypothetical protein